MKKLIPIYIVLVLLVANIFYPNLLSVFSHQVFGAITYPTSIDSFVNPTATSPANNPSLAGEITDKNNAVIQIETKLGIGSSAASANSVLAGTGANTSSWTSSPTLTSLTLSNLLATGSSTLQNFTFVNGTGTQATTTNFFSTNLFGTTGNITTASINTLTVGSCIGCNSSSGNTVLTIATTSVQQLATTTIDTTALQGRDNYTLKFYTPFLVGSATTSAQVYVSFNTDLGVNYTAQASPALGQDNASGAQVVGSAGGNASARYLEFRLFNSTSSPKMGSFQSYIVSTTTGEVSNSLFNGSFLWANTTSRVTSIQIWMDKSGALFATGTQVRLTAE